MSEGGGRVLGMEPEDGVQKVVAEVPMAEMFKYATDLRSITQARGDFYMAFERYEEAPSTEIDKIINESKRVKELRNEKSDRSHVVL